MIALSNQGIGDVNGESVSVGQHKAIQSVDKQWGGCAVIIEISAKSTAIVAAAPTSGDAKAVCPQAVNAAKIIDLKLS